MAIGNRGKRQITTTSNEVFPELCATIRIVLIEKHSTPINLLLSTLQSQTDCYVKRKTIFLTERILIHMYAFDHIDKHIVLHIPISDSLASRFLYDESHVQNYIENRRLKYPYPVFKIRLKIEQFHCLTEEYPYGKKTMDRIFHFFMKISKELYNLEKNHNSLMKEAVFLRKCASEKESIIREIETDYKKTHVSLFINDVHQ